MTNFHDSEMAKVRKCIDGDLKFLSWESDEEIPDGE